MSFNKKILFSIGFFYAFTITLQTDKMNLCTSVSGLEEALSVESEFIKILDSFLQKTETKLKVLQRFLKEVKDEHEHAGHDSVGYLANPMKSYLLLKRILIDWPKVEDIITDQKCEDDYVEQMKFVKKDTEGYPNVTDLSDVSIRIRRLQKVYKFETPELANGRYNGVQNSKPMTASDCFQLGIQLYDEKYFSESIQWFEQAEKHLQNTTNDDPIDSFDIRKMLAYKTYAYYEIDDFESALSTTNHIIESFQPNEELLRNKRKYEVELEEKRLRGDDQDDDDDDCPDIDEMFEHTCRQEDKRSPSDLTPLRCKYVDNGVPFLKIAPFKMEEIHLSPYVAIYHDVIYDKEITTLIETVGKDLERSGVGYKDNQRVSEIRTSKHKYVHYPYYEFLAPLKQRLIDLTGMEIRPANFQIASYGIGAHYGPHHDFFEDPNTAFGEELGNRLVTAMFYLNDVEEGGGTAFPFLKVYVPPTKGSLLYWYNLHGSLEPDYRTLHAGCPVIRGCKWIVNQWIHERGQEFLKPCPADFDPVKDNSTEYNC